MDDKIAKEVLEKLNELEMRCAKKEKGFEKNPRYIRAYNYWGGCKVAYSVAANLLKQRMENPHAKV